MVIGDLRGVYSWGNRRLRKRSLGGAYPLLVHQPLICQSLILPAARERGIKRKMAGSEESDKYKKKIFQKVGLFMIRHYL